MNALLAGRREPLWDGGRELTAQIFPDQFPGWFGLDLATGGQVSALLFPESRPTRSRPRRRTAGGWVKATS